MNKNLYTLIGLLIVVYALWDLDINGVSVLYPLKLLVVYFHEASHALMTIATGGQVKEFVVNANHGGHVLSLGGNRFWTLTAGYLGSLLWGSCIYLLAVSLKSDKTTMAILGGIVILLCVFFKSDMFTMIFGIGTGLVMLLMAKFASGSINDFVLRFIALVNMSYVPLDIISDTISRSHLKSDAYMLADEIGYLPTMGWGVLWLFVSAIIVGLTIYIGTKYEKK